MGGLGGPRSIQEALRIPRIVVTRLARGGGFRAVPWASGMPIPADRGPLAHSERHIGLDVDMHSQRVAAGGPRESGTFASEGDAMEAINEALASPAGSAAAAAVLDRGQDSAAAKVALTSRNQTALTAFRGSGGMVRSSDFFQAYGIFFKLKRVDENHAVVQTAYPLTAEKL